MIPLPPNVKDLRGREFGRFTVREFAGIRGGKAYWTCECVCLTRKDIRGTALQAGRIVSCGCQRADSIIRQAARLTIPADDRRKAAKGEHIKPPKPAAKPKPPRVKRILPFIGDAKPASPTEQADPGPVVLPPTPAQEKAPRVIWAALTKDRHGGYRVSIRVHLAANTAVMTSRRLSSASRARHEARAIFGNNLVWVPGADAGLHNQPWVIEIAQISIGGGNVA